LARKADYSKFQALNVQILGISSSNPFSQQTFAASHGLPYPLLSDIYMKTIRDYGTVYGETGAKVDYPGLEGRSAGRAFFLIDKEGIVWGKWVGEDMAVFPNEPLLKAARELTEG
jgi:peroxiredoxin